MMKLVMAVMVAGLPTLAAAAPVARVEMVERAFKCVGADRGEVIVITALTFHAREDWRQAEEVCSSRGLRPAPADDASPES